jgi:predicted Fe-S protein YdhL (DUF1289 family)
MQEHSAFRRRKIRSVPMLFSTPQKPILTPCIGICTLDARGLCEGCGRTGDEIARWMYMSDAERAHLMQDVLPRRQHEAQA